MLAYSKTVTQLVNQGSVGQVEDSRNGWHEAEVKFVQGGRRIVVEALLLFRRTGS